MYPPRLYLDCTPNTPRLHLIVATLHYGLLIIGLSTSPGADVGLAKHPPPAPSRGGHLVEMLYSAAVPLWRGQGEDVLPNPHRTYAFNVRFLSVTSQMTDKNYLRSFIIDLFTSVPLKLGHIKN